MGLFAIAKEVGCGGNNNININGKYDDRENE